MKLLRRPGNSAAANLQRPLVYTKANLACVS